MGKVTISTEEYVRLAGKKHSGKKTKHKQKESIGSETRLAKELKELEERKKTLQQRVSAAKQGKGFLARVGIGIGAGSQTLQLNKAINERKQLLNLVKQKKNLEVIKEATQIKGELMEEKDKLKEARKAQQKKFNEDIFNTEDIFKI